MVLENPNAPRENQEKPNNPQGDSANKHQGTSQTATPPKVAPSPYDPNKPCHRHHQATPWWWRIFEGAGIAAVITYTIITGYMGCDTHHNFIVEQKPWTVAKSNKAQVAVGQVITEPLWVMNIGKTPAKNVHVLSRLEVVNSQDVPTFDLSGKNVGFLNTPILYPGETLFVGSISVLEELPGTHEASEISLTQELFNRWNNREIDFMIYGRIEYDDIFKVPHWSTFCDNTYNFPVFKGKNPPAIKECAKFNDADNN